MTELNRRGECATKGALSSALIEHPYAVLAWICALCAVFEQRYRVTDSTVAGDTGAISSAVAVAVAVLGAASVFALWHRCKKQQLDTPKSALLCLGLAVAEAFVFTFYLVASEHEKVIVITVMVTALALGAFWLNRGELSVPKAVLLIGAVGFAVRLGYVLYTDVAQRQHDVHSFITATNGHSAYIKYIYENWSLPKGDPRETFQFYHPPLHHFISALWLKLLELFGVGFDQAKEKLQLLTLFYSSACMPLAYSILKEFGLKKTGLVIGFSIVALHPTFFYLSGSVNNDILSVLLIFVAILFTVRWYKAPSYKNIIGIALGIGLSMMTKLSGAIIAIPVAVVFLLKLFDKNYGLKKLFGQFAVFGLICIPLGMWWSVRCALLYGMPLSYVPLLSETNRLYVGDHSVLERLFSLKGFDFCNTYPARGDYGFKAGFYDYNIAVGATKTAIFGEYFLGMGNAVMEFLANVMYYSSLGLISLSLFGMGKTGFSLCFGSKASKGDDLNEKRVLYGFIILYWAVLFVMYVIFCFRYPHNCTMDFRYLTPTLLIGGLFLGVLTEDGNKKGWIYCITLVLTALFCTVSALFFAFAN